MEKRGSCYTDKTKADHVFKILLLGDSAVGKTCLLLRYCDDVYSESHVATIGLDYRVKTIEIDNKKIKLQIWDTAGQDRFRSITQSYYKGSHGILLLYDVTDSITFQNVKQWVIQIREYSPKEVILILVANKVDSNKREVLREEGEEFAEEKNMIYIETSAKDGKNVKEAFDLLYNRIYKEQASLSISTKKKVKRLSDVGENSSNSKCCK